MARTARNVYARELDWFKANELPECALLVDDSLLRFLVAWKRLAVTRTKRLTRVTKRNKAGLWQWLWQNAVFSLEDFAVLTGASVPTATARFKMLSGNAMIYPDGTLNSYVDKLLKARTVLLFQRNKPRSQDEARKSKPGRFVEPGRLGSRHHDTCSSPNRMWVRRESGGASRKARALPPQSKLFRSYCV